MSGISVPTNGAAGDLFSYNTLLTLTSSFVAPGGLLTELESILKHAQAAATNGNRLGTPAASLFVSPLQAEALIRLSLILGFHQAGSTV